MNQRWSLRPPGSSWGDFGADDQRGRGRLNLITPERRRKAAEEVREGIAFCLSMPLDCPRESVNPRRFPPQMAFSMRGNDPAMNYLLTKVNPGQSDVVCDDDEKLQHWLDDSGAAALISDNEAVELLPDMAATSGTGTRIPLHELCLFKLGMPLGEMFLLSDLADWLRRHQRSRFLLTAPPLRLPGAVGSPVTGMGTV